jgi:hypothetical protein
MVMPLSFGPESEAAMLQAVVKPLDDKWQVVVVDGDSEIIWSKPLTLEEARDEADKYNAPELNWSKENCLDGSFNALTTGV